MWFSLEVIRARKGDCLLLHFGVKDDPHFIIIDGGPSNVYRPHLKPRLERLREARNLKEQEPLRVDAILISHVDDDHIKGILELTRELRELKQNQNPLFLRARSLWHNSFDDLLETTPQELNAQAGFGAAAVAGEIEIADDEEFDAAKVLASIPQGRDLRLDAEFLKWPVNDKFKGKLIMSAPDMKAVPLEGGLKFTVIGPMKAELKKLQKEHDKWLYERKQKSTKTSEAALAAFIDKSIPNLSSIVLLSEAGGKRMLLTGDARGDKILEGLQLLGLLDSGNQSKMHVNILKVPHHGSANNLETSFFQRIIADHYVFSGNGEHGNPERESLEMLFAARSGGPFEIHFTYPIDEIDVEREKDWKKEQAKEKAKSKKMIREDWSPAKHSLKSFFKVHDDFAKKVSIVEEGQPHVIDLLDEFRF